MPGRALVLGLGVIGGSIARGLRDAGWHVQGKDSDERHAERALELGFIDEICTFIYDDPDLAVVAVPPLQVESVVLDVLNATSECVVTDVASVKQAIATSVTNPRFVPGHPMAGSEKSRLAGADPSLFKDCPWILTPIYSDDVAVEYVSGIIRSLGGNIKVLDADEHDSLVASISHTPQLLAVTLVNSVFKDEDPNTALLARMAGGGFRDMTRVASSDPGIWIDICRANSSAIQIALRDLSERLTGLANALEGEEHEVFKSFLGEQFAKAKRARDSLPSRAERLTQVVVSLNGRGVGEVFRAATHLDVQIDDWFVEDKKMYVTVLESDSRSLWGGLQASGMQASIRSRN